MRFIIIVCCFIITTMVLICLKLMGIITIGWWLVTMPTWLPLIALCLAVLALWWIMRNSFDYDDDDDPVRWPYD